MEPARLGKPTELENSCVNRRAEAEHGHVLSSTERGRLAMKEAKGICARVASSSESESEPLLTGRWRDFRAAPMLPIVDTAARHREWTAATRCSEDNDSRDALQHVTIQQTRSRREHSRRGRRSSGHGNRICMYIAITRQRERRGRRSEGRAMGGNRI